MSEADLDVRDARGEWRPKDLPKPSAMWNRPVRLRIILQSIFGHDGVLRGKNLIYMGIAVLAWFFFTPSIERTQTLAIGWIAEIYLRNVALLILIAGGLHLRLYVQKYQGLKFKFNARWLAKKNRVFLFGNQTWDNIFWSLVSGAGVWTLYEALTLWAYGNGVLPRVEWRTPGGIIYCLLIMIAIPFFRQLHFYWAHRWTHWKPLYKSAHSLHHRIVHIGPWSGLSMHPIEHLIYFSGVFVHWIIPSHPIHAVFHLLHTGVSPAAGHSGFKEIVLKDDKTAGGASYFHYLHHRYFECNYGNEGVPLDKWFGSFHDGSPEAHKAMRDRRKGFRDGSSQDQQQASQ